MGCKPGPEPCGGYNHAAADKHLCETILRLYGEGSLNGQEAGALLMLRHTADVELAMNIERTPHGRTVEADLVVKVKLRRAMRSAPDPIPFTEDVDFNQVKRPRKELPPATKLLDQ